MKGFVNLTQTNDSKINKIANNTTLIKSTYGGFKAGTNASGYGVVIGKNANAGLESIAIGENANVYTRGGTAIGYNAKSYDKSIQLGEGVNVKAETLQFRDFNIVGKDGKLYTNLGTETAVNMGLVASEQYVENKIREGIEETDPTVPDYVKSIKQSDIAEWNKVKNLGHVYRAKGSVQTYGDLPTNNEVGDVWNVIEAYGSYGAGTNFVWTDAGEWDALGGVGGVGDLSGLVTLEEYNKLVNNETQIKNSAGGFFAGGATRYSSSKGVGIGTSADAKGTGTIAIGNNAKTNNSFGVAIGASSYASDGGVSIGLESKASGWDYVAIGHTAKAEYDSSSGSGGRIQIGSGTNITPNTLQIFDKNIYNHSTDTLTVANITLNGEDLATKLEGAGGVSQEDFDKLVNNTTQIVDANGGFYAGGSYKGNKGIAIGQTSSVSGNYGTAIGYNAKAGSYGVALGSSVASQTLATTRAIQLGEGLNYTEKSLQVFNDNIYKADTHTLTVQNIELNGVNLGTQLGDLNTALEAILGV